MFKQPVVKAFSIVAMVLSIIGLLINIIAAVFLNPAEFGFAFYLGIVSWALLLWASIIGFQLCNSYKLYEDEYKKVGIRIYLIIVAFALFFFVGVTIGLALSVILLSVLWALKKNYDEWEENNMPYTPDDTTPPNGPSMPTDKISAN